MIYITISDKQLVAVEECRVVMACLVEVDKPSPEHPAVEVAIKSLLEAWRA